MPRPRAVAGGRRVRVIVLGRRRGDAVTLTYGLQDAELRLPGDRGAGNPTIVAPVGSQAGIKEGLPPGRDT